MNTELSNNGHTTRSVSQRAKRGNRTSHKSASKCALALLGLLLLGMFGSAKAQDLPIGAGDFPTVIDGDLPNITFKVGTSYSLTLPTQALHNSGGDRGQTFAVTSFVISTPDADANLRTAGLTFAEATGILEGEIKGAYDGAVNFNVYAAATPTYTRDVRIGNVFAYQPVTFAGTAQPDIGFTDGFVLTATLFPASEGLSSISYGIAKEDGSRLPSGLTLINGTNRLRAPADLGLAVGNVDSYVLTATDTQTTDTAAATFNISYAEGFTLPGSIADITIAAGTAQSFPAFPAYAAAGDGMNLANPDYAVRRSDQTFLADLGVAFDTTSRVFSTTNSVARTSSGTYIFWVSDENFATRAITFTLRVYDAPSLAAQAALGWTVGFDNSVTLPEMAGGLDDSDVYTLAQEDGSALPSGMVFNANTREFRSASGLLSATETSFTLTAVDNVLDPPVTMDIDFALTVSEGFTLTDDPALDIVTAQGTAAMVTLPNYVAAGSGTLAGTPVYAVAKADGTALSSITGVTFDTTSLVFGTVAASAAPADSGDYILTVTDGNSKQRSITFNLRIYAPVAAPSQPALSFTVGNQRVFTLVAATGGDGVLTYSITTPVTVPGYLSLDPITRVLRYTGGDVSPTVTVPGGIGSGTQAVVVTITDAQGAPVTVSFNIEFFGTPAYPVAVATTTLGNGYSFRVGTASPRTLPSPTNYGTPPFTYKLTDGAYSAASFASNGLSYSTVAGTNRLNVEIAGTPTAAGNFPLWLHLRDFYGVAVSYATNVTILGELAMQPQADFAWGTEDVINDVQLASAINVGGDVSYALTDMGGGGPTLPGVTYDAASNTLGGTVPTTASENTFTLTATDSFGDAMASVNFIISVTLKPSFSTTMSMVTGSVGAETFTAGGAMVGSLTLPAASGGVGGIANYTETGLPSGLTAVEQPDFSVIISGTPTTEGDFIYTRTAYDAGGRSGEFTLTFTINARPSFAAVGPFAYTANQPAVVNETLAAATGGTGTPLIYTLAPAPSTLEDIGLTFNLTTLALTGTPTAALASTEYTLTATDTLGSSGSVVFALEVFDEIGVTVGEDDPDDNTQKLPVAFTIGETTTLPTATGGEEPITYALGEATGDLLSTRGITFDAASRTLSAATLTVNAAADLDIADLTYTATDANGATASDTFSIRIQPITQTRETREVLFIIGEAKTFDLSADFTVAESTAAATYALAIPAGEVGLTFDETSAQLISDETFAVENPPKQTVYEFTVTLHGAVVTQEITLRTADPESFVQLNDEILSKFAGVSIAGMLGAIADRIATANTAVPYASIGGQTPLAALASGANDAANDAFDNKALLANSKFVLPFNATGGNATAAGAVWGGLRYRHLSGDDEAIDWDGGVNELHLGFDFKIGGDTLLGLAVSQSDSTIDYEAEDIGQTRGKVEGEYEMSLSSAYPYINWRIGDANVWAAIGAGVGDLTITENGNKYTSDMSLTAGGVGGSNELSPWLQLRAEARGGTLDVEGNDDGSLRQQDISTSTVRGLLKWHDTNSRTDNRAAYVEIGLRSDGGDGDNGTAMESALGWNYLGDRTTIEVGAHGLFGRDEYNEWGAYGNIRVSTGIDGQGFALRVRPSYGEAGEFGQVWNAESIGDLATDADADDARDANYIWRTESRLSYGIQSANGYIAPFFDAITAASDIYRLGVDWSPHRYFDLNLTGEQRHNQHSVNERRVLLQGEVKF